MIARRSLAANSFALLMSQYGLTAVNILFAIYLLRVLPITEVAVIAVFDILITFAGFSDLGLVSVMIQQAPGGFREQIDHQRSLSLIKCAMYYQSIALLIIGMAIVIFAPWISQFFLRTSDYSWAVMLFAPGAIFSIWFLFLQCAAQVTQDFYLIARWQFLAGFFRQLLAIGAYFLWGFPGYVVGIVTSAILPVLGMGWSLRKLLYNAVPAAPFWGTFLYAFPFYIRTFMRFGFLQLDQILVGALLTPGALATYSVARRLANFFATLITSFQTPLMIRMASLRNGALEGQESFTSRSLYYVVMIIVPLGVGFSVASPWLLQVYGGAKYADGWPITALLALVQVEYAIYTTFSSAVFAYGTSREVLLQDASVGLVNFVVAPVLIIVFGLYGAVWGQFLGYGLGIFISRCLLQRRMQVTLEYPSLLALGLPLLFAAGLAVIGQIVYFSLWVAPFYYLSATALFVGFAFPRLKTADRQQFMALVPARFQIVTGRIGQFLLRGGNRGCA